MLVYSPVYGSSPGKLLTTFKKGSQVLWNLPVMPLIVFPIFSTLMFCMTVIIHWLCDGGVASFHWKRMSRLANREVKATTLCMWAGNPFGSMPNTAALADGAMLMLYALEMVSKIIDQKLSSVEHDQNMWRMVAGACLHLSHNGLMFGNILASLAFERCSRCIILNCISACRAHVDEEWTLDRAISHSSFDRGAPSSSSQCLLTCWVVG